MADDVKQTVPRYDPVRVRRQELIRPAATRWDFTNREAQRHLQRKERPRWALVAYAVFLVAVLVILGIAYTTYAFSLYRGVILPGVHVDNASLAGMSDGQARKVLDNRLAAMYWKPVHLVSPVRVISGPQAWDPGPDDIGYHPDVNATVSLAMQVGRHGSFLTQLIDRLPIHPEHGVPLIYPPLNNQVIQAYIQRDIAWHINIKPQNAGLQVNRRTFHVDLVPSHPGVVLDVPRTVRAIQDALGSLTRQSRVLPVDHIRPVITNSVALGYRSRIERFLDQTPVIGIGKRVVVTSRRDFAPMFKFKPQITKTQALIVMYVDSNALQRYVSNLAQTIDREPQDPKFEFAGNQVRVLQSQRLGRTLDQSAAYQKLSAVILALKPNARLRFPVTITKPAIDTSNPATLGIDRVVGVGETSFIGASTARLNDIVQIASHLQDILINPDQDISFNQLVTTDWPDRVYVDKETEANGQLVPGDSGAMQQVATTFFRALYNTGLSLVEIHHHAYRLAWYEPPYGQDAVVSPGGKDLVFHNNTGKYLLLGTRIEPVRQELYIYVYGPNLGWKVVVDNGTIVKKYPHGPQIVKQDFSLAPGDVAHQAWPHDGAEVVVQRMITYGKGHVTVEKMKVHYQPWQEVILFGSSPPTATPGPTAVAKRAKATPGATPQPTPSAQAAATPTAAPLPTPTPTYNH